MVLRAITFTLTTKARFVIILEQRVSMIAAVILRLMYSDCFASAVAVFSGVRAAVLHDSIALLPAAAHNHCTYILCLRVDSSRGYEQTMSLGTFFLNAGQTMSQVYWF